MKNEKEKIAEKVLDYWFAIEFLGQDSYEMCTDERKTIRELNLYKKSLMTSNGAYSNRQYINVFDQISSTSGSLHEIIAKQAAECRMSACGNLTIYMGKVKRQICIESLAFVLGIPLKQAEKNTDDIAILSFQCDSQGQYIDHSLSFSTIVWALSQVTGKRKRPLSEILSEENYIQTITDLENKYFKKQTYSINGEKQGPELETITIKKIFDIFAEIKKSFEKYVKDDSFQRDIGIKYQLFKNTQAKERYDEDDYMGLSHDFFSSDIKMVKTDIEKKKYDFSTGMLSDLLSYICSPYSGFDSVRKHDLVKPKNKSDFFDELSEILNAANAPIAKWPSRYMPALMQEVAINFAISKKTKGIFAENGCIFSVNGPPGTGKTTLLKEIIASNIVEKAIVLTQYKTPDDAFTQVKFKKGKYHGAYVAPTNGYRYSPFPGWFAFKDNQVSDYGILVTSCNNAAVENITKELPLEKGITDNLETRDNDSAEMKNRLNTVRKLFSTENQENNEDPGEIYFTKYARKLFETTDRNAQAWGLIAVPLGKQSNINSFYRCVLNPILNDYMFRNADIKSRVPDYRRAREEFLSQLKKVRTIQNSLSKIGEITLKAKQAEDFCYKRKNVNCLMIRNKKNKLREIDQKLQNENNKQYEKSEVLRKTQKKYDDAKETIEKYKKKIQELSDKEIQCRKDSFTAEHSVSLLTKTFRKSKYNAAIELAQSYEKRADSYAEEAAGQSKAIQKTQSQLDQCAAERVSVSDQLERIQQNISSLEKEKEKLEISIRRLSSEIKREEYTADKIIEEKEKMLNLYKSSGKLHSGQALDKQFVNDVLSEGRGSVRAQTANPWMTEEYNEEREKLFYLALQMTKEFLLSSTACRRNLMILAQYWGLKAENGHQKIKFHPDDKEAMMGSLLNTLFLLTPVISSTFASVERLLKDVKEPGVIGTLIIDEAGQAQPQMAVGALFRARRSIIVGDPKQVEPVVTDDLNLLKEAYSEPIYEDYKNKSLSVQSCADVINPFGTFLENGTDSPEWLGCPLLVHRRCISPMYEISNQISYNGIMKQQTLPPSKEKIKTFLYTESQWFDIKGEEKGHSNHFVPAEGEKICEMVNAAFEKSTFPNLYIISPFTSVVSGVQGTLRNYRRSHRNSAMTKSRTIESWINSNIGTVHKFQGKEANEVIFALGCDEKVMNGYAVKGFVNSNIVNVAATRAKYRLYVVGSSKVWNNNQYVKKMKSIIDAMRSSQ